MRKKYELHCPVIQIKKSVSGFLSVLLHLFIKHKMYERLMMISIPYMCCPSAFIFIKKNSRVNCY